MPDSFFPDSKLVMVPGPTNVPERIMSAMLKPMVNHRSEDFARLLQRVTEKSKGLFQTENDPLVLSASGTGGVEAAVWNIVRPGDRVLVPVFGEFGARLAEVIELAGGQAVRVSSDLGSVPSLDAIEEAAMSIPDLKAIFIVHNETSTGCAVPYLQELGALSKRKEAFLVVDAVSSLGGYSIPVDRWGVDICITATQKCLAAPPGLSLLSLSDRAKDFVRRNPPKVRYFDLGRLLDFMGRWETPFTPAVSLYYALDEALDMLAEEGLDKRVVRHTRHARDFYSAMRAMELEGFAEERVRSNTVISIKYPDGIKDREFRKHVGEEYDVVLGGGFGELKGRIFRIGSMGVIDSALVHRTVAAIALGLSHMGRRTDATVAASAIEFGSS